MAKNKISTVKKAEPVKRRRSPVSWGVAPVPVPQPFGEQGSGGTAIWSGRPQNKESSPKWNGPERFRTSAELAVNVSVVAAGVHYFLNLISHPKWIAQPSDPKSQAAIEMADFVNKVLNDTDQPWPNIVRHAGMFRFHGFSIQEWIAKHRPDGTIGIQNIEVRPQHTIDQWAVSDRGTVLGVFQNNPLTNELLGLPRAKLIYIVEDTLTDSPEGMGVFRHLGESYNRLKRFMELEARAYERDLRGIPVGRAPLSAIKQAVASNTITEAQANQLIEGMKEMIQLQVKQSDTGLLLDSQPYQSTTAGGPTVSSLYQWSFELLNGPGLGLVEISAAIDRLQREMARVIGVEHLMLGDGGGSRAVAQDKSRNVYLIASSVLRLIVASMQKDLLTPLWALNGFDDRLKPKLTAEDISPRDVVEVGTTLARMAQSGAVLAPDDPVINDVRDMLGVSRAKPIDLMTEGMMSDEASVEEIDPLTGEPIEGGEDEELRLLPRGKDKPLISAEMQRLPRNTAANTDPVKRKRLNGAAHARS